MWKSGNLLWGRPPPRIYLLARGSTWEWQYKRGNGDCVPVMGHGRWPAHDSAGCGIMICDMLLLTTVVGAPKHCSGLSKS